ncbi:unnamed protein product [Brassicogethes aeneus]|uniref:chitin synthase n=1 Tax=Brassicogethes aeneus TaxID=1431903 RepID=A0A9P0FIX6_BRAAE|nr:unnamed protein product [Brassicogethes aeneus]
MFDLDMDIGIVKNQKLLGFAVLSKGTTLFMTSQIKPNATRYYCKKLALDPKQQFRVTLPLEERSQWIWMLLFAYFVPELGTFVRSLRICYFKTVSSKPTWTEWLSLFVTEICPAIGSALLIFVVLPELDVIKGAMLTNAVCLVPGLVAFLSRDPACKRSLIPMILDVASLACQTVALVLWPLIEGKLILYTITASVLLISVGWWENFVSKESPYFKKFTTSRLVLENKTYFMYLFLAPMKCLAFFITACVILVIQDGDIGFLFRMDDAFSSHNINITEIIPIVGSSSIHLEDAISTGYNFYTTTNVMTPIWVWLINILATYLCYAFGKFSCKILMQSFCFAFPINLTVPVVIAALIGMSGEYNVDVCAYRNIIPEYLFFNTPSIYFLSEFIGSQYSWIWVLWLFSQSWITIHIWYPHVDDKLARTEKLFYKPMYDAFLIDQSIALNRRRNHPNKEKSEAHIFFDDAFVLKKKKRQEPEIHVNRFVKDLIEVVSKAPAEVLGIEKFIMAPPIKTPTPYGGRLEWTLPGGTKMYAHLKDKSKIRPKKRWSQVMYMYYLLGHKLIDRKDLTNAEKVIISANTYILALDGDIDFQPKAVHALIDLMKKTPTLGAACGRIHPIGHGAMYAVGHWLQKATEHVIGCVLCSPGCFSLFRGTALMGDSVMKKYTTVATEPIHLVQYDQGEDRWLCTLLLQQGYRVEYSAASDSYTHCPEGFNEFYNQRRRWMPSTTANIIDLLQDAKHTVKINDNISQMYIFYQVVMLIGTVLGSGTIFLMLVGAFVAAFKLDQWTSFGYNLVPILVFVIICATCKADTQLFFAGLISAVYGLIMMAVLVGVLLQIKDDGWFAPSTLFFFMMAGEFIVTALLHPSEFYCLKYGVIYYVTVPSMYMLLVIYSVFNMNNVSWGTRDVTVEEEEEEDKDEDKEEQDKNAKKDEKKIFSYFGADNDQDAGSIEFSFAGLFKLMFCTHKSKDNEQLILIQTKLEMLMKKLDHIET